MPDLSFSDFDVKNYSKLDKKERGYDTKDESFYRYVDTLSHQALQHTEVGRAINTIDDIRDSISIFVGVKHAEKEYERAINAFNSNENIKAFSKGLNYLNNNDDFSSRLDIKNFSSSNMRDDFSIIANNYNDKILDPNQKIRNFKLVNNSVEDTLNSGVIKIITVDGKEKELSLKYRINAKLETTSARTLEAYLKDYSEGRSRLERRIANNSKAVSDFIKSDVHLSNAFAGKSSKDIDNMIKTYKSHEKNAMKRFENGLDMKEYKHDALVNLVKQYPDIDVVSVAEGIRDTKRIAEKQTAIAKAKNRKKANISKSALRPLRGSDMMSGFNVGRTGVDVIRKTVNMSKKFSENAATKMYSKAGKQQVAAKEKIEVLMRKNNGHGLSLSDHRTLNKLQNKSVRSSIRQTKAGNRLNRINAKKNKVLTKRNKKLLSKQTTKSNKMMSKALGKKLKSKSLSMSNLFSPMNIIKGLASCLPVIMTLSLILSGAAIASTIVSVLGGGGGVSFQMSMVTEGIRSALTKDERRDYLCDMFIDYNTALKRKSDNKEFYQNSVLAGYAAYTLYISNNGDPIYNYENTEKEWGMFSWNIVDNYTLLKKLKEKLDDLDIEVLDADEGILIDNALRVIADTYEDVDIKEDLILYNKNDVYHLIRCQAYLCMYSLELDPSFVKSPIIDPEVQEYLSNYKGNTEDDAVVIVEYLAEKLGKRGVITEENEPDDPNSLKFTKEELDELRALTRSIANDEIRTSMDVVFDYDGIYTNEKVPISPGQIATIYFPERAEVKKEVIFKPNVFGIENYTFTVTAKIQGMYTEKNGQGIKVLDSEGNMTDEIEASGGYGDWKTLYAYYGNYTPIEVPTYCVSEETSKMVEHKHSDACEKELICEYSNRSYHPHDDSCVERYEYYNYRNELIKTTKKKDNEFSGGYCKIIYKCEYKDATNHPHKEECYNYLCDTTPVEVPGIIYTYAPYWKSDYNGGTRITIVVSPDTGLPGENGGQFIASPHISKNKDIIFEAPDNKSTIIIFESLDNK